MPIVHKRLLVFVILSLSIHGFWFMGQNSYRVYIPEQADSVMAVRIIERPPGSQTNPAPRVKQENQSDSANNQATHNFNTQTSFQKSNVTSASVLSKIKQRLTHEFVYPVMARRMGWQGRVLLGFQIDATGSIQKVHIKQSSGHAILDNSAMATLNKIGAITIQHIEGFIGAWQLEIPVIYRLEG